MLSQCRRRWFSIGFVWTTYFGVAYWVQARAAFWDIGSPLNCLSCNTDAPHIATIESALFWFDSLCPNNNLSVIKGGVFLGWTSTKLGLMYLAQGHNAVTPVSSNPRPLGLESITLPLSHCAPWTSVVLTLVRFVCVCVCACTCVYVCVRVCVWLRLATYEF